MCNIGALVSVRKASTADLVVSRENLKTQASSNSNATLRCGKYFISRVSWFKPEIIS